MFDEEDFFPISALQHLIFCPRQCALIHMDRVWEENNLTIEGKQLHDRVHQDEVESRPGVRIVRALWLRSLKYGISGIADVVEFHDGNAPYPVEYKRGRSKRDKSDEVQLCAQAICLEEMMKTEVPKGSLYYWQPRRREEVMFSEKLRNFTLSIIQELREMLDSCQLPKAVASKKCVRCSLIEQCMPALSNGQKSADDYFSDFFRNNYTIGEQKCDVS